MGFISQHMLMHIVAMGIIAPGIAFASTRHGRLQASQSMLGLATLLQIALLWAWHAPGIFAKTVNDPALFAAMHVSLLLVAIWFWVQVLAAARCRSWAPMAALLTTGKLFCLLGLLLAFAPRTLYAQAGLVETCLGTFEISSLADQQIAGLLMLTACPIIYVAAATGISARLLNHAREAQWLPPPRSAVP